MTVVVPCLVSKTFFISTVAISVLSGCDSLNSSSHLNQVPRSRAQVTPNLSATPKTTVSVLEGEPDQSSSFSGGWIGGGGDSLRLRFEEGKNLAEQLALRVDLSKLSNSNEIEAWILKNRDAVINELRNSPIVWIDDSARWNCAKTDFHSGAAIELSRTRCAETTSNREEAAKLFIHEVTHHLGVTDESFADRVAIRFFQLWETQLKLPWCSDSERRNAIAPTRLAGAWEVDEPLSLRLGFPHKDYYEFGFRGLIIADDPAQIVQFPGIADKCAYMAGRMTIVTKSYTETFPYVLVQQGGNPRLVFLEGTRTDGSLDLESFHLMLVAQADVSADVLLVGDEHPTMPFRRK